MNKDINKEQIKNMQEEISLFSLFNIRRFKK
jgi:hypothetical protein